MFPACVELSPHLRTSRLMNKWTLLILASMPFVHTNSRISHKKKKKLDAYIWICNDRHVISDMISTCYPSRLSCNRTAVSASATNTQFKLMNVWICICYEMKIDLKRICLFCFQLSAFSFRFVVLLTVSEPVSKKDQNQFPERGGGASKKDQTGFHQKQKTAKINCK